MTGERADRQASDLRHAWDEQAAAWSRWTRSSVDAAFFDRYNLPSFLELVPPARGLTLEIGCGEGRVARTLVVLGHQVVGVDGSPTLAALTAEGTEIGTGVPASAGDAAALPIAPGVAELVVAFMVMQDVDDLSASMREVARVLQPGGRACIAVLHPFDTAGQFDGEEPDAGFRLVRPYPEADRLEDRVDLGGDVMVFHCMHRPIGAYVDALADAGLLVERLREPVPDDDVVADVPRMARQRRVPAWMHLRAVKPF